jgi:ABC-type amino acid transport substrate-binding protein
MLALLGVVFTSAGIRAQDDQVYSRVMSEKRLRVFAVQFPPQIFQEHPGAEWTGFDADVFRYIAKRLGVEVEFVPTVSLVLASNRSRTCCRTTHRRPRSVKSEPCWIT